MQTSLNVDQTQPLFRSFQGISRSLVDTNNLEQQLKFQQLKSDIEHDYDNEPTKTNSFYKIDQEYDSIFSIPQMMTFQKKRPTIFSSVAHETFGSVKTSPLRSEGIHLQKAQKQKLMSQSIRKFQCDLFLMKLHAQLSNYKKKLKQLKQISHSYQKKQKKVNLIYDTLRQKLLEEYKIINNQNNKSNEEVRKRWLKRGSQSYNNIDKVTKDIQLLVRKISVFPESSINQDSIIFYKNFLLFLQFQANEITSKSNQVTNLITKKINKYFSILESKTPQISLGKLYQIK